MNDFEILSRLIKTMTYSELQELRRQLEQLERLAAEEVQLRRS